MEIRFKLISPLTIVLVFLSLAPVFSGQCQAESHYSERLAGDIQAIGASRDGMQAVIRFMDGRVDVFLKEKPEKAKLPNREQRIIARQTWVRFLDHIILLDTLGSMYSEIYKDAKVQKNKAEPFRLSYAAFLAEYRYAMDFIERVEKNPAMHVVLNEPMAELGIEKGSYARLKYRFLNVVRGAEFARLNVLYNYYGKSGRKSLKNWMDEDIAAIWQAGRGKGPALTAKNAGRIVADLGFTAWFPLQKGVSRAMGHTKVWRPGRTLITQEQIVELAKELEPGDILLERREWYATNAGIPGFWPHAALYIGSAEERQGYFTDPEVSGWLSGEGVKDGNLDTLLKGRYPGAYEKSRTPQEGHLPRVIEAIEGGVSLTTLEHSAAADSLVVLRPKLPKKAKASAILRSFQYQGRPYDFNFDFRTDSELVCSELIYKAYEVTNTIPGLNLPVSEVLGRPLLSPNNIAQLFAEEYLGESPQLEFVYFLDGNEMKQKAFPAEVKTFLASWQRPKWHVWVQNIGKHNDTEEKIK